jgi:hypothetical protein
MFWNLKTVLVSLSVLLLELLGRRADLNTNMMSFKQFYFVAFGIKKLNETWGLF